MSLTLQRSGDKFHRYSYVSKQKNRSFDSVFCITECSNCQSFLESCETDVYLGWTRMSSSSVKGLWNVVLSGYPRSGKTMLAKRLVGDYQNFARISVDELRTMFFREAPPCRDEYALYSAIADMRDFLLRRCYSVVIDATAPDNITKDFLLTTKAKHVNRLLVIFDVDRSVLTERSIERCGDASLVLTWDKRWQNHKRDCCLFKFKSNNVQEFDDYYTRLTELLESEMHPFKPEFHSISVSFKDVRKALRHLLERHSKMTVSHSAKADE
jgi:predicted kinase